MNKYIDANSVDLIKDEQDVVKIIGKYVDLKKSGSSYKGVSPFTNEKTPSFMVSQTKNIWKCFSSGLGGDAISFLQKKNNISFYDAIIEIAEIQNITIQYVEQSKEYKEQFEKQKGRIELNQLATNEYLIHFNSLDENHWSKKWLKERYLSLETQIKFMIGYAPDSWDFLTDKFIGSASLGTSKDIGLIASGQNKSYDFWRDRLMFPVQDEQGRVVAFGGRCSNEGAKSKDLGGKGLPKYVNTKEVDGFYDKSKVLYGLYQAKKEIVKQDTAILVEGYTDVTAMHDADLENTVATCGTALTPFQAKKIKKYASTVVLFRDGDDAGVNATKRDIPIVLKAGLYPYVFNLEGIDPQEFILSRLKQENVFEKDETKSYNLAKRDLDSKKVDAIDWLITITIDKIKIEEAKNDKTNRQKRERAIDDLIEVIILKQEHYRNSYIKKLSEEFRNSDFTISITSIKQKIKDKELLQKRTEELERKKAASKNTDLGLPQGADKDFFIENGFIENGNVYQFQTDKAFVTVTNHRYIPLFHIDGQFDNKRIFEIHNNRGVSRLIDIESKDTISWTKFQERLIQLGDFTYQPKASNLHFKTIMNYLHKQVETAHELTTLGWQKERFYAFSNAVFHDNEIHKMNEYGIVKLKIDDEVKLYWSPSSSKIYSNLREDNDIYENDKKFSFKDSSISITEWLSLFNDIYPEHSKVCISWIFATVFRDLFIKNWHFFPLLGLFGEKGSGKSAIADSINAFFNTSELQAFNLNSGSTVGFSRRLARNKNTATVLEEYNDGIDPKKWQMMKSAYDGVGREIGSYSSGNRTETSKVQSSICYVGQYLPLVDANSLLSRTLVRRIVKTGEFSNEAKDRLHKMREIENKGINSLCLQIIKHRELVESKLSKVYSETINEIKLAAQGNNVEERTIINYASILSVTSILYDKIDFPFTYQELFNDCILSIIDSTDLISDSDGLAEFWNIIQFLSEQRILPLGDVIHIETHPALELQIRKGEMQTWNNNESHKILFISLKAAVQHYQREVSRREGTDFIKSATLRQYFQSKKYYIGNIPRMRLGGKSTSWYAFDYTVMQQEGIIELEVPKPKIKDDDLDDLFSKTTKKY